jgi:predicted DNA-binding protein
MAKPKKKKDQHKSGFMVRLPVEYREKLLKLTERTRRKITVEVQIALDKHFRDEKIS